MIWIKVIPEHEATGELKKIYREIRERRRAELTAGPPFRPYMLHSLNPKAMWHISEFRNEIFCGKSRLTTAQRKMISAVTSAALQCSFCTLTHAEFLRTDTGDDLMVEQLKKDWRQAQLGKDEYAMLEYVEKLTLTPSSMTKSDIEKLRKAGWTDRDILDIVQICAYMNFRTRVVDALGLEPSEWQIGRASAGSERAVKYVKKTKIS